jgi:hypothetical protein
MLDLNVPLIPTPHLSQFLWASFPHGNGKMLLHGRGFGVQEIMGLAC